MRREEILSVAKPILFNTDMVGATLDDRKSVTRRVVKPQPILYGFLEPNFDWSKIKRPYHPEDILYVRETWRIGAWNLDKQSIAVDYATGDCRREWIPVDKDRFIKYVIQSEEDAVNAGLTAPIWKVGEAPTRWRPSIHMPKEAARIFLRIMDVWVERLQDMTDEGCAKEGIQYLECPSGFTWKSESDMHCCYTTAVGAMRALWDSTIRKKDLDKYSWNANPWAWVIQFERVDV